MKIDVKCKVGMRAYYLSETDNTLIPCICTAIHIDEDGIEYYFDVFTYSFYDYEFGESIFTDYNLACDALEDYRATLGDINE